jgi:hypothetical protein
MSNVKEPWKDTVPITQWTVEDFKHRDASLSVYESNGGQLYSYIDAIATAMDESHSFAVDRAVRCFIAAILDECETVVNAREEYETYVQIPPHGWIETSEKYPMDVEPIAETTVSTVNANTAPVVRELLQYVQENCTIYDTQAAFIRGAVQWFAGDLDVTTVLE